MLFMVVETFRNQDAKSAYRRFRDMGRVMPEGLSYVGSWTTADLGRCFQLMETDDVTLLQKWVADWADLVAFEIVPVVTGKETSKHLPQSSSVLQCCEADILFLPVPLLDQPFKLFRLSRDPFRGSIFVRGT